MRRIIILLIVLLFLPISVNASEFTAPVAPEEAQKYMPEKSESFIEDLLYVVSAAIGEIYPHVQDAAGICVALIATTLLISVLQCLSDITKQTAELVGVLSVGLLLLEPTYTLITLGIETVTSLCQYGKLLLPVMTAAMAAQGAVTTSTALYTGTALFNTILTSAIQALGIPMTYIYLVLGIANSSVSNPILQKLQKFIKWCLTWTLKLSIYLFTGYLGITRVVSGTVDASAIKATKLALSGLVPVIGKVISDASETILLSADVMKNAAGIYGLVAIAAICIIPFIRIGIQYLMLKITASVSSVFGCKSTIQIMEDFSCAMGFLLAMTGTLSVLLLVSTVCFMKGVG